MKLKKIPSKIRGFHVSYFWPDDHAVLAKLTDKEIIEWFVGRTYYNYLNPLIEIIEENNQTNNKLRTKGQIDFMIGTFSVLLNGIESMGSFVKGEKNTKYNNWFFKILNRKKKYNYTDKEAFTGFVNQYLKKWSGFSKKLYRNFRCGIAHGFLIENGGILYGAGGSKGFDNSSKGKLIIDPWIFLKDLVAGVEKYFDELGKCQQLRINFFARFNELYK